MVQTVFAPEGDINLEQLWKEITPEQLMDSKLKCVFELPAEQEDAGDDSTKFSPKMGAAPPVSTLEAELRKEVRLPFIRTNIPKSSLVPYLMESLLVKN